MKFDSLLREGVSLVFCGLENLGSSVNTDGIDWE